jgi:Ca2+-binding EF-hand superfamily protein
MLAHDRNGDGKLSRDEATGLLVPHFDRFDANRDGRLDADELREAARWLNSHHQPGLPVPAK